MGSISGDQVQAAYEIGKQVYEGEISHKDGVEILSENHGMNEGSALNFIGNFKQMRKGVAYHRTLSRAATEVFFKKFFGDYGDEGLKKAIEATRAHADYYESLGRGRKTSIRQLCDEFEPPNMDESADTFSEMFAQFEREVSASLQDNSAARRQRLEKYNGSVGERFVTQKAFVRNPDIVAETLLRADGRCEFCGKKAPFIRKNRLPYLEVHHRTPLAEGGKDILENTLALCPNCHREAHYGMDYQKFRK